MDRIELTPKVVKMMELPRANPALAETMAEVLDVVGADPRTPGTIDAAEERLVAPLQALGLQVPSRWAEHAEAQAGLQLQAADPSARVRGKKTTCHCGCGTLAATERVWRDQAGAWQRPFATTATLSARGSSRRLQRLASDFALEEPFGRAAARLREHHISPRRLTRLVENPRMTGMANHTSESVRVIRGQKNKPSRFGIGNGFTGNGESRDRA